MNDLRHARQADAGADDGLGDIGAAVKRSKTCGRSSAAMPMPLSSTVNSTPESSAKRPQLQGLGLSEARLDADQIRLQGCT